MAELAHTLPPSLRERPPGALTVAITAPSGGVGKTTLTTHLAVGLLKMGVNVGVADLDVRDRGLTAWLAHRRARHDEGLVMPAIPETDATRGGVEVERREIDRWPDVRAALVEACDVVLIDTQAGATASTNEAIRSADVIFSLVSFATSDVERLFQVSEGEEPKRPSAYSRLVWEARRRQARLDLPAPDWLICPARKADGAADNDLIEAGFQRAVRLLGARLGPTFLESPTVRAAFGRGLTALDEDFVDAPMASAIADDVRSFIVALRARNLAGAALSI